MQGTGMAVARRPFGALLLSLALLALGPITTTPHAQAAPASLGIPDVTCSATGASVNFRWAPAAGASEQWLDVSTRNDNFAGTILSAGPLDATVTTQRVDEIRSNTSHYWRVNSRTASGWEASTTSTFVPCPAQAGGASTKVTDGVYTFGDDIAEPDREKVRKAVTFALKQAAPEGDFKPPNVYAYSTPDQLAEAMSKCVNETSALLGFKTLWQNSGTIAVAFSVNFFIYAGGPHWKDVSLAQVTQTVAHEYFHVLQRELTKFPGPPRTDPTSPITSNCLGAGFDRGPTWLTEGSAELFGWLTVADAASVDMKLIRDAYSKAKFEGSLKDFEESLKFQSSSNHSYPLGFMATDYASKGKMAPVFEYYRQVGKGVPWKEAFAKAFGVTLDYFYEQFEAYKANGYR
jgi:hypothetical protein